MRKAPGRRCGGQKAALALIGRGGRGRGTLVVIDGSSGSSTRTSPSAHPEVPPSEKEVAAHESTGSDRGDGGDRGDCGDLARGRRRRRLGAAALGQSWRLEVGPAAQIRSQVWRAPRAGWLRSVGSEVLGLGTRGGRGERLAAPCPLPSLPSFSSFLESLFRAVPFPDPGCLV